MNKDNKPKMEMRTVLLWLLAGGYLAYTGYRLCVNVIQGEEGTGWGFMAAGIAFVIVGVFLLVVGGKNFMRIEKEKREAEENVDSESESAEESTDAETAEMEDKAASDEPQKPMSIADRAKLVSRLEDSDEDTADDTAENSAEDMK